MTADLILVCDPNPEVQRALRMILRRLGYSILITGTGKEALECNARYRPSAVIVELALPDVDGIELCRRLRERGQMPILVLSAIDEEDAKVTAFESGVDDYMTKPFSPGELTARLAARLRTAPAGLRFEADGLEIDLAARRVTIDGQEIHLTKTEFALLRVLATSRGTVTYRTLASKLWGRRSNVAPTIRSHIANLRAKLDAGRSPSLILTEIGIGYRFTGTPYGRLVPDTRGEAEESRRAAPESDL
jgi:two-component system KDP operon response regulator KdpE